MNTLLAALQVYESDYGIYPPGAMSNVVNALRNAPRKEFINGHWNEYMEISEPRRNIFGIPKYARALDSQNNYLDPWGTPFFLSVSDKDGIEIRSFGPNRKDDGGRNDDLALSIPFAKDTR